MLLAVAANGLVERRRAVRSSRHLAPGRAGWQRFQRTGVGLFLVVGLIGGGMLGGCGRGGPVDAPRMIAQAPAGTTLAALRGVAVRGRAPKTGYTRLQFGPAWADVDHNGCDTRDDVLRRDLTVIRVRDSTRGCVVIAGRLADPYTGKDIAFAKAAASKVQIDHVVALSDAWQTGAQNLSAELRRALANDPLNLLAVDGAANQQKSDGDAATWLPPRKAFRCIYVSRQVAVKVRYRLWVTAPERDAIARVLRGCPDEPLP